MTLERKFFASVLPDTGLYITVHRQDNRMKHNIIKSVNGVVDFCHLSNPSMVDCWFAPSSFSQGWHEVKTPKGNKNVLRTQDNVAAIKSLWMDIDVGEDKPYATRLEASQALTKFIKAVGLPRPWVIGSGALGLHVYWPLTNEINKDEWQDLADRLHQATKELKLHADPSRTRDSASIMRCPLTWNTKVSSEGHGPTQVQILLEGVEGAVEYYKSVLSSFTPEVDRTNRTPTVPTVNLRGIPTLSDEYKETILNKYFASIEDDYPKKRVPDVLSQCEQLRLQNGAIEPVWRGMLATIRHCEHGRHAAHKISRVDPRYTYEGTEEKLNYLEDNDVPPYRCDTFRDLRPEVCQRCPLNGVVKSPISTPPPSETPMLAAAPVEAKEPTEGPSGATTTGGINLPDLSPPEVKTIETKNSKVSEAGCYCRLRNADGDFYWSQIYEYPVYPVQRIKAVNKNGDVVVSYVFRKHNLTGHEDFQLSGEVLMGQGLPAFLGSVGFLLRDKDRKHMGGLLIDILKQTEATLEETEVADSLGWDEDQKAFLLGNKLYKTSGDVVDVSPKGKASEYSNQTVARGDLEVWKSIANVYNREGLEWGQAAVASAFASPLMPIGSLEKAALLFLTGEKGTGKSTALALAVSVYGNPARLMINKDDTYLARLAKLGIMNNISAAFDEMTDLTPREASELAYQITQGRGKDRMAQGGEGLQHNTTYWSCLPIMSANDSIIAALSQHSSDPTAQMSRVLEIKAVDINSVYSKEEFDACERLVRKIPQNFGTAGDLYMRYVTAHLDEINELIFNMEKRFLKYTKLTSNYRFWTYMCTRMLVGVMIANKLGLVKYDVAKLFKYLVDIVTDARKDIDKYKLSPESLFPQFLSSHLPNRLVVQSPRRPKSMPDNPERGAMNDIPYVVFSPSNGRELVMRVEMSANKCVISTPAIREWCKKMGVSYTEFLEIVDRDYKITSKRSKRDLGSQTVYRNNGKVDTITVVLPDELLPEEDSDNVDNINDSDD